MQKPKTTFSFEFTGDYEDCSLMMRSPAEPISMASSAQFSIGSTLLASAATATPVTSPGAPQTRGGSTLLRASGARHWHTLDGNGWLTAHDAHTMAEQAPVVNAKTIDYHAAAGCGVGCSWAWGNGIALA